MTLMPAERIVSSCFSCGVNCCALRIVADLVRAARLRLPCINFNLLVSDAMHTGATFLITHVTDVLSTKHKYT